MKVTEISVKAGRTFNNPYESFSNLRPEVEIKATLDEGEDPVEATKALQAKAEQLVEDHKGNMLHSLKKLNDMTLRGREIEQLSHVITRSQERLDALRKEDEAEQLEFQPA